MKHFKNKINNLPVHFKLLAWFLAFSFIMLILLWLFQTIFFSNFYKRVRVNQVEDCAHSIEGNISDNHITSLIDNLSDQNDVGVYVFDTSSSIISPLYSTDSNFMKRILSVNENNYDSNEKSSKSENKDEDSENTHKSVLIFDNSKTVEGINTNIYYDDAKDNGGTGITYIDKDDEKLNVIDNLQGDLPPMDKLKTDTLVYTRVFTGENNREYMVIITSRIAPVGSIISTIRYQLIVVSLILLAIGIFVAILASRKISKPIKVTTENAKLLAQKNYDAKFDSTGYLEVTELNKTLTYATNELKKVENLQHELIANISHDLRTPLTMITGYGEVMRDLPGENTPENIQIIIDEANRLNTLVTDLLDISKLQAGAFTINREVFSITELVRDSFQRYNKLKEQEGYNLTFKYDRDIFVKADISKIGQVFYNLVNNAINYSRKNKLIEVRQIIKENKVFIEVEDHGDGIDKEHLENIWDRYYKVDKEHKSSVIGTGLGLSIVKNILDAHNAHYGVRSELGVGSVFWFELEIYNEDQSEKTPDPKQKKHRKQK